jgi:hypothetical protein
MFSIRSLAAFFFLFDSSTCWPEIHVNDDSTPETFLNALYSLQFRTIQIAWNMAKQFEWSGTVKSKEH